MRVLHLIPSISPLRGGPSQAVLSMVAALRQQGVDSSILTTNDHGPGVQSAMPLGRWHEQEALGQAVPVLAFGRWNPPLRAVREFAIAPGFSRWLGQHAHAYDLVHVHALFSYTTSLGMAQLRRQGVPYLLRTIGQLNRWSLGQSAGRKQLFLKLVDQANLQGARALHFTSEAEQQEAADLHVQTSSFVLPLGVPEAPAAVDGSAEVDQLRPTRFVFLSRLHPKKQLPLLFEALTLLQQRQPARPWQLDIAGEGDPAYVQELRGRTQALGIAHQVHWHGFVGGAAKQALLQQADWFVLPSASENFGIAAAEALMAGTPVLLSPGVALAADVAAAGAGVICEPTPEALSACLERCLEPPPAEMLRAARQLAETHYGWPAISRQLIQHYEEVLRG
ncbi:glycosyltransferase [Synechococcus sp. EJ6-Ellesmere]|uniref:glycosyltransferase n=1 Tax=Synechococcus sp. EJ6-Ellesmere TaxID=2823734 RepID=UPI0020CB7571|nr:glycosyltransferase [Synechococcus sp. EJ6-Ellesmere]MCP9825034.1 glycosyltransferase [Synechococcus sp. EJ6-Ellesmere]